MGGVIEGIKYTGTADSSLSHPDKTLHLTGVIVDKVDTLGHVYDFNPAVENMQEGTYSTPDSETPDYHERDHLPRGQSKGEAWGALSSKLCHLQ